MKTFGGFIKEKRLSIQITLREFCKKASVDPSNWSKVERGILPPPKSREILEAIAFALDINIESEDWNTMKELAVIGNMPQQLLTNDILLKKLPVFFRTVRGDKPTKKDLDELIKILREE